MASYRRSEALLLILFAACVVFQLFLPPAIGLANNGDFAKMIGRFSLGSADGEYGYFTTRWHYDRAFEWVSDDRSSELMLISAAVTIGWWFESSAFDIRILGAIHALLWIGCFAAFLPLLRPLNGWRYWLAGIFALGIFSDASYIAHCNSFYTDVAGFIFLAWALVLWLHVMRRGRDLGRLFAMFALASILCVLSKAQHAPLGLFFCAMAAFAIPAFQGLWHKIAAVSAAAAILLAAVVSFRMMPDSEKEDNQFHVIFMSVLRDSPTPSDDLRELGLGPEYLRYVGYWPLHPGEDLMQNADFRKAFTSRTSFERIALFHLRHPVRTLAIIYRAIRQKADARRALGNYERSRGLPAATQTKSFGWWSAFRSALFRVAPWHIVVWYAGILGAGVWLGMRRSSGIGWFVVLLAAMGLVEVAVSALGDVGETERHFFLFHAITDFTMLVAVFWALLAIQEKAAGESA